MRLDPKRGKYLPNILRLLATYIDDFLQNLYSKDLAFSFFFLVLHER